jgi:hypothetical protein
MNGKARATSGMGKGLESISETICHRWHAIMEAGGDGPCID